MEFRLIYEGPLKSNRGTADKHFIRRQLHSQLQNLVSRPPMRPFSMLLEKGNKRVTIRSLCNFRFVPIISESLRHTADLEITLLMPEEPGRAITQGGDLDNRLKTLLDGLRCPKVAAEIPKDDVPATGEDPFLCLLEDDSLVSRLSVVPDRLLRPVTDPSYVVAIIRVTARPTYTTIGEIQWITYADPGK